MYTITAIKKNANKVGTFITESQKLFIYSHEDREDLKSGIICETEEQVFKVLRKVFENDIERASSAPFERV